MARFKGVSVKRPVRFPRKNSVSVKTPAMYKSEAALERLRQLERQSQSYKDPQIMAVVQSRYGDRDPNEKGCRTCVYWQGDRSWPINEQTPTGLCSVSLPPYLARRGPPETKATDGCRFHEYASR